ASEDLWVVDRIDDAVYRYADGQSLRSGSQSAAETFTLAVANTHAEGIADPPVLTLAGPADGAALPAGPTAGLPGQAPAGARPAAAVRVNGQAVDAEDAGGSFFHRVQVAPGANTFVVEASDAAGGAATSTVTVQGTQAPAGAVDFSRLSVVSGSALGLY